MQFFAIIALIFVASASAFMSGANMARRMSNLQLEMSKVTGKVKFFDSVKGFGFITPDEGGEDVFVHQTAIFSQGFRSLAEGEEVEFEVGEDTSKGKKFATNVTGPNGSHVMGAPRREKDMRF